MRAAICSIKVIDPSTGRSPDRNNFDGTLYIVSPLRCSSNFPIWMPIMTNQNTISFSNQLGRILLLSAMILTTPTVHAQQVAFTWDDLPSHSALPPGETRVEIGRKLIAAMKDAHMPPAYGFLNGVQTEK